MRLIHNMASLSILREQNKNLKTQGGSINRISSGVKINSAKDDPNQIARSEKINMQIRGMQVAQRNLQDGASMLQTADGGLDNATSMLQRIRELTVQAGGANSQGDVKIIQGEINQMVKGINDVMNYTNFNGVKMLADPNVTDNTNPGAMDMTVGADPNETAKIPTFNLNAQFLGDTTSGDVLSSVDVTVPGGIDKALDIVDKSLSMVTSVRSRYGALQNRFDSTGELSTAVDYNLEKADSELVDADIAGEMMEYARSSILIDAGNALLAQTNRFPQEVLKILDNVK